MYDYMYTLLCAFNLRVLFVFCRESQAGQVHLVQPVCQVSQVLTAWMVHLATKVRQEYREHLETQENGYECLATSLQYRARHHWVPIFRKSADVKHSGLTD